MIDVPMAGRRRYIGGTPGDATAGRRRYHATAGRLARRQWNAAATPGGGNSDKNFYLLYLIVI